VAHHLLVSPTCSDLAEPNFELKQFPDGENYVWVPQADELKGKKATLLHRLYPHQHTNIFRLFQLLKVAESTGAKLTAVAPYFPYARQDQSVRQGEALSAQMLCRMLANAGLEKLITFDCHFISGPGEVEYEGLKIENRSMASELLAYIKPKLKDPLLISTGGGSTYMVKEEGGLTLKKVHGDYEVGEAGFRRTTSQKLDFDVAGKDIIILDDLVSSGSTMAEAVRACKSGGARRIICGAVHGLLVGNAFDRIRAAGARELVVTDTVPGPAAVVSIAPKLGDILR